MKKGSYGMMTASRGSRGAISLRLSAGMGLLVAALAVVPTLPAEAFVLDWATLDWTAGTTNQTYVNVNGSGIKISIQMGYKAGWDDSNYLSAWRSTSWPDDSSPETAENANVAWQAMDSFANTNQYVSVLFTFYKDGTTDLAAISNVTLKVEDVDSANESGNRYRDEIRNIQARDPANATTLYATGASYAGDGDAQRYAIVGSGASLRITANNVASGSDNMSVGADTGGDVNINFSTQVVSMIYYRYGNNTLTGQAGYNPTLQWTGPGLMNFEVVPEPSTTAAALLGVAILFKIVRRKNPPVA